MSAIPSSSGRFQVILRRAINDFTSPARPEKSLTLQVFAFLEREFTPNTRLAPPVGTNRKLPWERPKPWPGRRGGLSRPQAALRWREAPALTARRGPARWVPLRSSSVRPAHRHMLMPTPRLRPTSHVISPPRAMPPMVRPRCHSRSGRQGTIVNSRECCSRSAYLPLTSCTAPR